MDRRALMRWTCRILAAGCAAVVAIPGVRYVIAPLRRGKSRGTVVQRLARVDDLQVGIPKLVTVTGSRRDAWTLYPEETIGRVWLVLREPSAGDAEPKIDAFSAVCPHLGCAVQLGPSGGRFLCPCHNAVFSSTGEIVSNEELGYRNPTPRGMDTLESRIVEDETTQEKWIEVEYQKFKFGLTEKIPKA